MRLLRTGARDPALNLALDEALLRSGRDTLRLYGWDPPGLSLGYFQPAADFETPDGYSLVRRPTGGGAIAHTGELTVSWVGRRRRVGDAYERVNEVVQATAATLGVEGLQRGTTTPRAAPTGFCFDHHTCYDLLAGPGKVFGSAQRRAGDHFLLHGTLVLQPNPLAEGAACLSELAGRNIEREEAENALVATTARLWGVRLTPEQPTPDEWALAETLVCERYAHPDWTYRR